jgi:nitrate reductase gamma subunit
MNETEFLIWVRGPAFQVATIVFVVGVVVRVLEILLLGRKKNLAEARGSAMAGGLRTIFSRFWPDRGTLQRSTFTVIAGYVFHIGLFITIFLSAPHILLIRDVVGIGWASLPTTIIDATTVVTIITLLAVLVYRLGNPVQRFLSGFQDYFVWLVTFLPMVTGYLAFHRIGMSPPMLLAVHILSVELLMVTFPFTKLMHAFTLFMARWYNGAIAGYRGVHS